jgi:hypothetical protein
MDPQISQIPPNSLKPRVGELIEKEVIGPK